MNSLSGRQPVHALWQLIRIKVNAVFGPMLRLNILRLLENGFCNETILSRLWAEVPQRGRHTHTPIISNIK